MPADRIPDLHPLLVEVTAPGDALKSYRCRQCGQVWQQHMVDGEALVVQVGWGNRAAPSPTPRVVAARPPASTEASRPQPRRRSSLVFFVLLAAVFFVISTLPPFVTGSLARGAWMARWIVGGLLLLLGVQTVLDLARKVRKRA